MNLVEHMQNLIASRQGKSCACLAERVNKSENAPFGFNVAAPCSPEEVMVLMLTGTGNPGEGYRAYNGYLKKVDEYIKKHSEFQGQKVRACVAVIDMGDYHRPKEARCLQQEQYKNPGRYLEKINQMSNIQKAEYVSPAYIEDIFNFAVLNRISGNQGKIRLSEAKALRNTRRLIIIDHCHGGYVALKLEEMMQNKMAQLGYSDKEKSQIQKQLLIMSYSPDCPLGVSKSKMVSFSSAQDYQTNHGSGIKNFLSGSDFGLSFFPGKKGNLFLCSQVDKAGIEGNPPRVYVAVPIDEWWNRQMQKSEPEPEDAEVKTLGEHDFMGFEVMENMSKCSTRMMGFANNILKNALLNSLSQKEGGFKPLPPLRDLAAVTAKQKLIFSRAVLDGYIWWGNMKVSEAVFGKRNSNINIVELD